MINSRLYLSLSGCVLLCLIVVGLINSAKCFDQQLRRESIVYGLSSAKSHNKFPTLCDQHLSALTQGIDSRQVWALQMMDASGQPEEGFIWGNNYWLGKQSQCLYATDRTPFLLSDKFPSRHNVTEDDYPPFPINFFAAYARHNFSLQKHINLPNEDLLEIGLCLPYTCKPAEIQSLLQSYFNEHLLNVQDIYNLNLNVTGVKNMIDDHKWLLSVKFILMMFIILLVLSLNIIGTAYDCIVYQPYLKAKKADRNENDCVRNEDIKRVECGDHKEVLTNQIQLPVVSKYKATVGSKILLSFSMYSNVKFVLSPKIPSSSIPCIHGLRFGGMIWIIVVHGVFYLAEFTDNKPFTWIIAHGFSTQILTNASLAVDTFFFISGFLVSYLYYKAKVGKPSRSCNIIRNINELVMMTVRRYVRLTPVYLISILIIVVSYEFYSKVSIFEISEKNNEICSKYWWRNALYINNLYPRSEMCLSWSWYLSNDMQFFIIGSALAILSSAFFIAAFSTMVLIIILSVIITGYISYTINYIPTLDEQYHFLNELYDPPWVRIGPYLVGVITGYIAVKLNGKLELKKSTLVICWIVGPLLNLVILFGLYERNISALANAFYQALSRTMWSVGIAWLLIACITNHAGIINKILSYRGFIPFSRMTYCAYLLNPYIISSLFLNSEVSTHGDLLSMFLLYMGIFTITFMSAFAMTVLVETPSILLMKIIVDKIEKKNVTGSAEAITEPAENPVVN